MIASKLQPHADTFPVSLPPSAIKTRATAQGGDRKCRSCKPLPAEFRSGGFTYRQIVREGNAAIYEQRRQDSGNVAYEVVRIRRRAGFEIKGKRVEPAEVYPTPEAWGVDGHTFTDKDAAFAKLREVLTTSPASSSRKRGSISLQRGRGL